MPRELISQAGSIKTFLHTNSAGEYQGTETYQDAQTAIDCANERQRFDPKGKQGFFGENGRLACRLPAGLVEKLAIEHPGFMKWPAKDKLKLIKRKTFENSWDRFAFSIR